MQTLDEQAFEYSDELVARIKEYYGHTHGFLAGPGSRIDFVLRRTLPDLKVLVGPLGRVLDYGCGTASSTVALCAEAAAVEGFDIDSEAIEIASAWLREHGLTKAKLHCGSDASAAGVPARSFDLVYMNAVIERVPRRDRPRVLRDAVRCLRPGGVLAIAQSPNRWWPRDVYLTGLWFLPWLPVGSALAARYAARFGRERGLIEPTPGGGERLEYRGVWGVTFPETLRSLPNGSRCLNVQGPHRSRSMVMHDSSWQRRVVESVLGATITPLTSVPVVAFGPMFSLLAFEVPETTGDLSSAPGSSLLASRLRRPAAKGPVLDRPGHVAIRSQRPTRSAGRRL